MLLWSFADIRAMEILAFLSQAYFVGKPKWDLENIPDQTGKVVIITGGNVGLGREVAKFLLLRNAKVYIACRNESKARIAISELRDITGKDAIFLPVDLADLKSVKAGVDLFLSKETQLHALYNNAGVLALPMNVHINGYDMQIHTNVLGHFYLTKLLLPTLLSVPGNASGSKARVINLSSSVHHLSRAVALDFNTFKVGPVRDRLTGDDMYIQSKFANIVFANELARRYGEQGIVSMSVNPGNLKTSLSRHISNPVKRFLVACLQIYPAEWGALTELWAGTSPDAAGLNGKYIIPWGRVGSPRPDSQDPRLGKDLWEWLEEQIPQA